MASDQPAYLLNDKVPDRPTLHTTDCYQSRTHGQNWLPVSEKDLAEMGRATVHFCKTCIK